MPTTKATMLFQLSTNASNPTSPKRRVGGWSESWYYDGDITATLAFLNGGTGLCAKRAALLPIGSSIVGQRLQPVVPLGPSVTRAKPFPAASGLATDIPQMALYVNCPNVAGTNIKRALLRGIPDSQVDEGEFSPNAAYTTKLNSFIDELQFWRFKHLDLAQELLTVVTVSAGGLFTTVEDHPYIPGDIVTLKNVLRVTNDKAVTGKFRVIDTPTLKTFTVMQWSAGAAYQGQVRRVANAYSLVNSAAAEPVRIVTRKVGRPFDQYVGRR